MGYIGLYMGCIVFEGILCFVYGDNGNENDNCYGIFGYIGRKTN